MAKPRLVYCSECHKLAVIVTTGAKSTKVIQDGRVLLNLPKGDPGTTLTVQCPEEHDVIVEVNS